MDKETIYKGRDNIIDILLYESSSVTKLSGTTHVALVFSGITVTSVGRSGWFDWLSGVTGQIKMKLGGTTVTNGTYDAELIVYNTNSSNGIFWGTIPILVKG